MGNWRRLLAFFPSRERGRIALLLASTTVSGLLQAIGVAAIMPFIAVVADPDLVADNAWLSRAYAWGGFADVEGFLVFLGLGALAILVATNLLVGVNAWLTFRVCHLGEHDLARRLLRKYLTAPYQLLLQRNSTELLKILVSEIERVVIGTLMAGIGVFADLVTTLFIIALLVWIHPGVTLATLAALGLAYAIIYRLVIPRVVRLGAEFPALNTEAYKNAQEALAAAREIRVLGVAEHFVDRFSRPLHRLARNAVRYSTLDIIPAQALELVAFGGLIAATIWMIRHSPDASQVVPTIAMFGFAAYRLIPALKDLFDGIEAIRYNMVALEPLWQDYAIADPTAPAPATTPLHPREAVRLEAVSFTYPGGRADTLRAIDLRLAAGSATCFAGPTGAGKSTTVDLLLGLLEADRGNVLVDNTPVTAANRHAWQRSIGYVPQSVFLLDDTVAANIALGIDPQAIDPTRLERAARLAEIHDFIVGGLPQGYQTLVGERGASLSGGQRQRIGIARALYRDPPVLVFDESTNELDPPTEERILDSLRRLGGRTLVFVSHRPTVAAACDQVVVFNAGRVVARGSYASLSAPGSRWRSLLADPAVADDR